MPQGMSCSENKKHFHIVMGSPSLRVRTITAFVSLEKGEPHVWRSIVKIAATFLRQAQKLASEKYDLEVQTVRLCTNNFVEYVDLDSGVDKAVEQAKNLESLCAEEGLTFVSIGGCTSVVHYPILSAILSGTSNLFGNIQIGKEEVEGLQRKCEQAAECVHKLSYGTGGESFRFTVCACCPPGIPFFPAAYNVSPSHRSNKSVDEDNNATSAFTFAFGTENSGLLYNVLKEKMETEDGGMQVDQVADVVRQGFDKAFEPLAALASELETTGIKEGHGARFTFEGIDSSIAPGLDHKPLTNSFELFGFGPFGSPGTMAICSMITKGLQSLKSMKLCGYSGLMLPVCEDVGLAEAYSKGGISINNFLEYSSVCGVGLDTFPIAGDTTTKVISGVLMDVCRLAQRWNKPLSCRLLPCVGKKVGERTSFDSPYLVECKLQSLIP